MSSQPLRIARLSLLASDITFFSRACKLLALLRDPSQCTEEILPIEEAVKSATAHHLHEDFARWLFSEIPNAACLRFIAEISSHLGARNAYVHSVIAKLKKEEELETRDVLWEEERSRRIQLICGDCGISNEQIAQFLEFFQASSRSVIDAAKK